MNVIYGKSLKEILKKLKNGAKKLWDSIDIPEMKDWESVSKVVEEDEDTGAISLAYMADTGLEFIVDILPTENENKYDFVFTYNGKKVGEVKNSESYGKEFLKVIEKLGITPGLKACKHIKAKLKKIQGARFTDITLSGIKSNLPISDITAALDVVVSDDSFIEQLPMVDTDFDMLVSDEDILVVPAPDVVPDNEYILEAFKALTCSAFNTMMQIWGIHWNVLGDRFYDIHGTLDNWVWELKEHFDALQEWCSQFYNESIDVLHCQELPIVCNTGIDGETACNWAIDIMNDYLQCIDIYKNGMLDDVFLRLTEWHASLDKSVNYFMSHYAS